MIDAATRTQLHESCRLQVYDDATGLPIVAGYTVKGNATIGYGRLLRAPGGISPAEARALFDVDWRRAQLDATTLAGYASADAVRRGVLEEMTFQLGVRGVRGFKRMLSAFYARDYAKAADEMLDSAWARQTPNRARELANLMRTGEEKDGGA